MSNNEYEYEPYKYNMEESNLVTKLLHDLTRSLSKTRNELETPWTIPSRILKFGEPSTTQISQKTASDHLQR